MEAMTEDVGRPKPEPKWNGRVRKLVDAAALLFFLLFVGAALYFFVNVKKNQQKYVSSLDGPEEDLSQWILMRDVLLTNLAPVETDLPIKLQNPSSNERRAVEWMAVTDKFDYDWTTASALIQRYSVVATSLHFDSPLFPDKHECDWFEMECRHNVVRALNFTGVPLWGTVPASLAHLSSLEVVDLSNHNLRGSLPREVLMQWTKLKYLDISGNQLTSTFNSVDHEPFWTQMEEFFARNNLLREAVPETVAAWSKIRRFEVQGNRNLTGPLLEYVAHRWTAIETLVISHTNIIGSIPDSIGLMTNLQTLTLSAVPLSGTLPSSIGLLTNLKKLELGQSELAAFEGSLPSAWSSLSSLEQASLVNLKSVSGTLPASWGTGWQNVRLLDLYGNEDISGTIPSEWSKMSRLQILRIAITGINGTIPSELGVLSDLQELSLFDTDLTGSMPKEICQLRLSLNSLGRLAADCDPASTNIFAVECSYPDCCTRCY